MPERFPFARRVLVAALVVLAVFGLAFLALRAAPVLLLGFGGVLFGVLLDGLARALARRTPLSRGPALAVVGLGLLGLLVGAGFIIGPQVASQAGAFGEALSGGLEAVRAELARIDWLQPVLGELDQVQEHAGALARRLAGTFSSVLGGLASIAVIVALGIYLAVDPRVYQRGLLHLVGRGQRARAEEVLRTTGKALRSWLIGQLITMTIVGTLVTVGLTILGVPLALTLGLIAFLLEFIPYLGPLAAFVPAVLVAFVESPELAVYTTILFGGIQAAESYLVQPLVQQHVVHLPPALLIFAEILPRHAGRRPRRRALGAARDHGHRAGADALRRGRTRRPRGARARREGGRPGWLAALPVQPSAPPPRGPCVPSTVMLSMT